MCAVIAIDYYALQTASSAADKAADYCEDYAEELKRKVTKKLGDLRLGGNSNTSQVNYFANQKIRELEKKKKTYEDFSKKVKEVREYAIKKDESVSNYIKSKGVDKIFRQVNIKKLNGEMTWGSFKYGMKSFFENLKTAKKYLSTTTLDRLNDFYEGGMKLKDTMKGMKIIDKFVDKGIFESLKEKLKDISMIYKYVDKISDASEAYNRINGVT